MPQRNSHNSPQTNSHVSPRVMFQKSAFFYIKKEGLENICTDNLVKKTPKMTLEILKFFYFSEISAYQQETGPAISLFEGQFFCYAHTGRSKAHILNMKYIKTS